MYELILWITIVGLAIINFYQIIIIGEKNNVIQAQNELIQDLLNNEVINLEEE